eukprot:4998337-Pyramimonas_sp.AAC.1
MKKSERLQRSKIPLGRIDVTPRLSALSAVRGVDALNFEVLKCTLDTKSCNHQGHRSTPNGVGWDCGARQRRRAVAGQHWRWHRPRLRLARRRVEPLVPLASPPSQAARASQRHRLHRPRRRRQRRAAKQKARVHLRAGHPSGCQRCARGLSRARAAAEGHPGAAELRRRRRRLRQRSEAPARLAHPPTPGGAPAAPSCRWPC